MSEWIWVSCPSCGGNGVREGFGGGPQECRGCTGVGRLALYPSDRVALYPGGPLRGTWPGEYQRAISAKAGA